MTQELHCRRFIIPVIAISMLLLTGAAYAAGAESGVVPALDCPPCDDENACTTDSCDTSIGECVHTPLVCNDANPCTLDGCHPSIGCVTGPRDVGTECDDGSVCTTGDACDENARCTGTDKPIGAPCDDLNACTSSDACNGAGACLGVPQSPGSACDDGLACTLGDACAQDPAGALTCRGTPRTCDPGDICTEDACDPATGQCVIGPVNCDDGSECTADSCAFPNGCQHRSRAGDPCDDHNACNIDDRLHCDGNRLYCTGRGGVLCRGQGPCMIGHCNPSSGCVYVARTCDDGNSCTTDSCDSTTGECRNDSGCGGVGKVCDNSVIIPPMISFKSPLGKGSGTIQWVTRCEFDLIGFNLVMIDGDGVRTQLNDATIPCELCVVGGRHEYASPIPKHRSGRNIYIEVLHIGGWIETLGPAERE